MSADITSALVDLVLAVTTIVGGAAVTLIRRHFSAAQISLAERIAGIAVGSAEQMAASAGWNGSQKLTSAMQDARDLGAKHGVKLTDEQWRSLLEQEVMRLHRLNDALTTQPEPAPKTTHSKAKAPAPATPPAAPSA